MHMCVRAWVRECARVCHVVQYLCDSMHAWGWVRTSVCVYICVLCVWYVLRDVTCDFMRVWVWVRTFVCMGRRGGGRKGGERRPSFWQLMAKVRHSVDAISLCGRREGMGNKERQIFTLSDIKTLILNPLSFKNPLASKDPWLSRPLTFLPILIIILNCFSVFKFLLAFYPYSSPFLYCHVLTIVVEWTDAGLSICCF